MNVLIVNDNLIGESNPVGYSMKNMLEDMPDVTFLQYCVDYRLKAHIRTQDALFCKETDSFGFMLKEFLIKTKRSIRKMKSLGSRGKTNGAAASAVQISASPLVTADGHGGPREFLRGIFYTLPCRVSKENLKRVKAFEPDVIYTLAENIRVIKFAIKLSKKLGIPIVYHGMDDWKDAAYLGASYLKPFRKLLYSKFEELHKYTVENIAICEKMAEYYSKYYGTPYTYASNCIREYNEEKYTPAKNSMTILFSGGLHLHRGEIMQEVAAMIEDLNREGYKIKMKVLAPYSHIRAYNSAVRKFPHTEWIGYGYPQTDKMVQFKSADILFHADVADEMNVRFLKYSFSTKLPEYFAIGRCLLAYGPKEIGTIQYIEDKNCGLITENFDELKSMIVRLYENPDERAMFAENAFNLGKNIFSQEATQSRIYGALKRSAEAYGVKS